jgi:hypothetical protein
MTDGFRLATSSSGPCPPGARSGFHTSAAPHRAPHRAGQPRQPPGTENPVRPRPLAAAAASAVLTLAACGTTPAVSHDTATAAAAPTTTTTAMPTAPATIAASAPSPAAPSPVSTLATLSSKCVAGIYDETASQFYSMADLDHGATTGSGDAIAEAYQLTLTDSSPSVTAEVTGFAAVFYSGGQELTSDSQSLTAPSFITPGQSLTWTEYPWGNSTAGQGASIGPFAAGHTGAVDTAATCQLVQWYHP